MLFVRTNKKIKPEQQILAGAIGYLLGSFFIIGLQVGKGKKFLEQVPTETLSGGFIGAAGAILLLWALEYERVGSRRIK